MENWTIENYRDLIKENVCPLQLKLNQANEYLPARNLKKAQFLQIKNKCGNTLANIGRKFKMDTTGISRHIKKFLGNIKYDEILKSNKENRINSRAS